MGDDAAARLRICLLGPVDVYTGDLAAGISQPNLRVLLAMLALSANRVVPVSTLIDALWQEDASRQREKNLHVQVHLLRRRLAELEPGRATSRIGTAPPGYRLALSDGELDAAAFAGLAARGRNLAQSGRPAEASEILAQALALWRGPALGDVAFASPQLEAEASGLEEQRLAVLEDQADAELAAGRHAGLAGHLRSLIAQYPLRRPTRWPSTSRHARSSTTNSVSIRAPSCRYCNGKCWPPTRRSPSRRSGRPRFSSRQAPRRRRRHQLPGPRPGRTTGMTPLPRGRRPGSFRPGYAISPAGMPK